MFVNIPMLQDANNAKVLMSWEAFSLARPGCSVAEYLCWPCRDSLLYLVLFRPNVTFAMLLDVYVILAIAFPGASYCASFRLSLCVHPSRCLSACILRDDFLNASSEVF